MKYNIAIGIPVLERIEAQTDVCIYAMIEFFRNMGVKTNLVMRSGIRLIHDARNSIVEASMTISGVTHLLFVDADMTFGYATAYKWLTFERDIIGGLYVGRGIPSVPFAKAEVKPFPYAWKYFNDIHNFKTVATKGCGIEKFYGGFGLGFCLIDINVFKRLPKPYFDFGRFSGEDMYFFESCIENNIHDINIDWDADLGHIGLKSYEYRDYLDYINTEEGKAYFKALERECKITNEEGLNGIKL